MLAKHFVGVAILAAVAVLGPLLLPGKPKAASTRNLATNLVHAEGGFAVTPRTVFKVRDSAPFARDLPKVLIRAISTSTATGGSQSARNARKEHVVTEGIVRVAIRRLAKEEHA